MFLLEDTPHAQAGLASALRIQLTGAAEVETRPQTAATGLPQRIAAATSLVHDEHALLVVWAEGPVELADGSQEAVLYAVGQREGRAQLEVVRVPGGNGPDMDRTLALKVRSVVDELHLQHSGLAASMQSPEQGEYLGSIAAPEPLPVQREWTAMLAAGVAAGPLAHSAFGQWGVAASAGPALALSRVRLAATLDLGWYPGLDLTRFGARVRYREIAPGLALRAAWRLGRVWLGARSGPALGFVSATLEAPSGARKNADVRVVSWVFGADVEAVLGAGFGVCLGFDLQARLRRQRFAINGDEVADLGRARPFARLMLTWMPSRHE